MRYGIWKGNVGRALHHNHHPTGEGEGRTTYQEDVGGPFLALSDKEFASKYLMRWVSCHAIP